MANTNLTSWYYSVFAICASHIIHGLICPKSLHNHFFYYFKWGREIEGTCLCKILWATRFIKWHTQFLSSELNPMELIPILHMYVIYFFLIFLTELIVLKARSLSWNTYCSCKNSNYLHEEGCHSAQTIEPHLGDLNSPSYYFCGSMQGPLGRRKLAAVYIERGRS